MSQPSLTPSRYLWRQAMDVFFDNLRGWVRWNIGFMIVDVVLFAVCFGPAFERLPALLKVAPILAAQHKPFPWADLVGPFASLILLQMSFFVQGYFSLVYFVRCELKGFDARLSVGRFFYFLFKNIELGLIFVGLFLLVILPLLFVSTMLPKHALWVVAMSAGFLAYLPVAFAGVRLSPLGVFAVCRMRPVIRSAWRLTRGCFWRLFRNGIMIALVSSLCMLVVLLVAGIFAALVSGSWRTSFDQATQDPICQALRAALNISVTMGFFCALSARAARILITEKRQSDPAFLSPAVPPLE